MSGLRDADTRPATTAVRAGQSFDEAGLARWMTTHVEDFAGPITVLQFEGGQSSPTYKLMTPRASYVLRRKPPGPILKGAHAVDREARVTAALGAAGYPVPRVHGLCMDDAVIGTAFYVMEMIEGRIFRDATFPEVSRADRPAYFDAMNATIAQLHRIDPAAIGLGDYGRPGNYYARQIARLSQQYLADAEAGRYEDMDRLVEWLPANLPPDEEPRIVHGDFRAANMIFDPTEPRVLAVLDWELSTLGAPLADFGYHAMMYRMLPEILPGLARADLAALNIPSERDYVAAYCHRTGRTEIPRFDFYLAFSLFRYAALLHGIKARALRGTASSAHAHEMARHLPGAARLAREAMDACR